MYQKTNKYQKISSFIVNNEQCYIDVSSLPDTNDFPYRRSFWGESLVKINLEKIFQIDPVIRNEKWSIPNGKIVNKIKDFYELYPLLELVISSSNDHWRHDQIIDYYIEHARISTPGYGEKYSPLEYWINPKLRHRWVKHNTALSLEEVRERIYENIQEARLAYASISKSLYASLMQMKIRDTYIILDIAAYGERAIAAAALPSVTRYDGVDPNYNLIQGHNLLSMDLDTLSKCNVRFIHVGMEDFKSSVKYDIITYSPPPFNTEPYTDQDNRQSYMKYPTFMEYFCCFLTEIIYKAAKFSNKNAIFSFTALDRNPEKFPIKISDKTLVSDNTELIYIEALLLVVSCLGFQYHGAIGLAAGGKKAGVPWWTFEYTETIEPKYLQLLQEHYPDIFNTINTRIIANYHYINNGIHPLFELYASRLKTNQYYISSYLQNKTNILTELVRLQIQQYIIEIISQITNIHIEKIRVILGRYLMLQSIDASYEMPWNSCLYLDPVFPTSYRNKGNEINEQIITYLIEQGCTKTMAEYIIYYYKYWFGSYECIGLAELYNTVAHWIHTLPIRDVNVIKRNGQTIIIGSTAAIDLLKRVPSGYKKCGTTKELWKGIPDIELLPYLRYQTLGAHGHQYTRPVSKTKIIEKIFNMPIIDIYASIYNNQSNMYCSIYPDIEKDSLGSAFCMKLIEGAYLANPVDVPVFLKKSVSNIIQDLNIAKVNKKLLFVSMSFNVWIDTEDYFITDFESINYSTLFTRSKNIGLNMLANSEFIQAVYILDKNKFPSISSKNSNVQNVKTRNNTISIGVILSSQKNSINNTAVLQLVENKKYVQYK